MATAIQSPCGWESVDGGASLPEEFFHVNGFDYENQAWVEKNRYVRCGHPATMNCGCYGRDHAGERCTLSEEYRQSHVWRS